MKATVRSIVLAAALVVSVGALSLGSAATALAAEGATPISQSPTSAGGSIFGGAAPDGPRTADPHSVELGVRFESSVPLAIEGSASSRGPKTREPTSVISGTSDRHAAREQRPSRRENPLRVAVGEVRKACQSSNPTPSTWPPTTRPMAATPATKYYFERTGRKRPRDGAQGVNGVYNYAHDQRIPDR